MTMNSAKLCIAILCVAFPVGPALAENPAAFSGGQHHSRHKEKAEVFFLAEIGIVDATQDSFGKLVINKGVVADFAASVSVGGHDKHVPIKLQTSGFGPQGILRTSRFGVLKIHFRAPVKRESWVFVLDQEGGISTVPCSISASTAQLSRIRSYVQRYKGREWSSAAYRRSPAKDTHSPSQSPNATPAGKGETGSGSKGAQVPTEPHQVIIADNPGALKVDLPGSSSASDSQAVTSTVAGPGYVKLTWPSTPGAVSYDVSRSPISGTTAYNLVVSGVEDNGDYKVAKGLKDLSYWDYYVQPEKTYFYVVTAIDSSGKRLDRQEACATALDPNLADASGNLPLISASIKGDEGLVEVLLRAGADPNATDSHGETALMAAASSSRLDIVKSLIDAGTDILAIDLEGRSAFDKADSKGSSAAVLASARSQSLYSKVASGREPIKLLQTGGEVFAADGSPLVLAAYDENGHPPAGNLLQGDFNGSLIDASQCGKETTVAMQLDASNKPRLTLQIAKSKRYAVNEMGIVFPEGVVALPRYGPYLTLRIKCESGEIKTVTTSRPLGNASGKVRRAGDDWVLEEVMYGGFSVNISTSSGEYHFRIFPRYRGATPSSVIVPIFLR